MIGDPHSRDRKTLGRPAAQDVAFLPLNQLVWTLSGFMLATYLSILNQTSLTTAMPRIIAELGGFDRYAWASSAYLLAAAVSAPVAGRLSDRYGRKLLLMLGLSVFILGSLLTGMSGSMTQLIAFRGVQGLGGGVIVVSCFVAIIDLVPPEKRGRVQGLAALVFVMAAVTGPPLGGFITDLLSWNWVLLVNVPAGTLVLLLALKSKYPRLNTSRNASNPDYLGMLTLVLAVVSLLLALSWAGQEGGWGSPVVVGFFAFGLVMAAVFVMVELKSAAPVMPIDLYRNRTVASAAALNFLAGFGLYGAALFAPLFLQAVLGATAAGSGGVLAPMMLGIVFGGILSGLVLTLIKAGYRTNAVLSAVALSVGMYLVATLDQEAGLGRTMAFLAVAGLGIGGALATANVAVRHFVPQGMQTLTASTLQFYRFLSGTLGLAFLGSVLNLRFSARLDGMMPESLRNALDPDLLDRIRQNLRVLVDPSAAEDLAAEAAANGVDGAGTAGELIAVLDGALAGAVQDVFMAGMAVTAFAVLAGLFLKNASTGNDG